MKNKRKDWFLYLCFIISIFISCYVFKGCTTTNECEESIICTPPGYDIIYNGEKYSWQIASGGYICPQYFDTKEGANENAFIYYEVYKTHENRYELDWEIVTLCRNI